MIGKVPAYPMIKETNILICPTPKVGSYARPSKEPSIGSSIESSTGEPSRYGRQHKGPEYLRSKFRSSMENYCKKPSQTPLQSDSIRLIPAVTPAVTVEDHAQQQPRIRRNINIFDPKPLAVSPLAFSYSSMVSTPQPLPKRTMKHNRSSRMNIQERDRESPK